MCIFVRCERISSLAETGFGPNVRLHRPLKEKIADLPLLTFGLGGRAWKSKTASKVVRPLLQGPGTEMPKMESEPELFKKNATLNALQATGR